MRKGAQLLGLVIFVCLMSGAANAALMNFNPGYGRLILKETTLTNSGTANASALAAANGISLIGTGTSLFVANSIGKILWQEGATKPKLTLGGPSASMWAEIDPLTNTVLQGRIDIFGNLLGANGLQFGADLSPNIIFKSDKIGFGQINHMGNICDFNPIFCSNAEELLLFKNLNFNGDFSQGFQKNAKVISTVPLPAAAWLFLTGIFGLVGLAKKQV